MGKIKSLRWETGTVLPDRIKHDTLSLRENTYFSNYSCILSEYCEDIGFDLTSDIEVHHAHSHTIFAIFLSEIHERI